MVRLRRRVKILGPMTVSNTATFFSSATSLAVKYIFVRSRYAVIISESGWNSCKFPKTALALAMIRKSSSPVVITYPILVASCDNLSLEIIGNEYSAEQWSLHSLYTRRVSQGEYRSP